MRESKFVEQNHEKWEGIESDLKKGGIDPQKLRNHMFHITDDLSYSRTFYKNRSVRIYLNGLTQQIYNSIYKNKKNVGASIIAFFKEDIPKIMYASRKELAFVFGLLILSIVIGFFSSRYDINFAKAILGESYVKETLNNIENGDPLGIYKSENQLEMFFAIASNNLRVSLFLFIFGIFVSYGSCLIILYNGIMLGTFMSFFYSKNLATDFNYTVWMHGTVEISTMVIVGVAGMLLGKGLIYPGTLSRIKAFSIWGRRGALLLFTAIPFVLFAAMVESFLTRYTEIPNWMRGLFILLNLSLIVYYFVIYPYLKFRNSTNYEPEIPDLTADSTVNFNTNTIQSNGNILLISIQLLMSNLNKILKISLLFSLLITVICLFNIRQTDFADVDIFEFGFSEIFSLFFDIGPNGFLSKITNNLKHIFINDSNVFKVLFNALWFTAILVFSFNLFSNTYLKSKFKTLTFTGICFVFCFLLLQLIVIKFPLKFFICTVLTTFVCVGLAVFAYKDENRKFKLQNMYLQGFVKIFVNSLASLFFVFFLMILLLSPITYFALSYIEINLNFSENYYTLFLQGFSIFILCFILSVGLVFLSFLSSHLAFTLNEISNAQGLLEKIEKIGSRKKSYGIETE